MLGKNKIFEKSYIEPEFFKGAKSFSFKRRKMMVYPNGDGNNPVPSEWADDGVTVYAEFMGEANGHVRYKCLTKDGQELRM